MPGTRSLLAIVGGVAILVLTGCVNSDETAAALSCDSDAQTSERVTGRVVRIAESSLPCRMVFQKTGTVLRGDPNGAYPDPGISIIRDSKGRFYTANAPGYPGRISLWNSDGQYLESFGHAGQGPGEIAAGVTMFIDADDRLHVLDSAARWHVFTSDQAYIRTSTGSSMGGIPEHTQVLDDGRILTSQTSNPDHHFQIVDSAATIVQAISSTVSATGPRFLAYAGGRSFWSGSITQDGYILEEWDLDGTLLQTFLREDLWPSTGSQRPPPNLAGIHLDDRGFILVVFSYPTRDWRPTTPDEMSSAGSAEDLIELHGRWLIGGVEVIGSGSGALLASERFPADSFPIGGAFRGTHLGFKMETLTDLLPQLAILEYHLAAQ